jgi:uncharacterized protein
MSFGIGLRHPHYEQILDTKPDLDFLEVISENYMHAHAGYLAYLSDLCAYYPIYMHGVSLSLGAVEPLDKDYLGALKKLTDLLDPSVLSDHLCYTGYQGVNTHDLLPIPYTEQALGHLIPRIHAVQEALGRSIALENASSYLEWSSSTIPESEFLNELCTRTGCGILLDVNNVYVSSFNHDWNPNGYIDSIQTHHIRQYHLGGHTHKHTHIIDTHNTPVCGDVWDLYAYTIRKHGLKPTLIEWDSDIPELSVLLDEVTRARNAVTQPQVNSA